jgi:flagellar export protein FliJ
MPFAYRLEVLLRLQRSLEHQEENRLLACAARIVRLKAELQSWEAARMARKRRIMEDLERGASGIVLQIAADWDLAAHRKQAEIRKQIVAAEQARREQMRVYREARQKREVLDSLRERQQTEYNQEEIRKLQQTLDEMYLVRTFLWKAK